MFKAKGCFYRHCPCQEVRSSHTVEKIWRGIEKRELHELRKNAFKKSVITSLRCTNVVGVERNKTGNIVKQHLLEFFPQKDTFQG